MRGAFRTGAARGPAERVRDVAREAPGHQEPGKGEPDPVQVVREPGSRVEVGDRQGEEDEDEERADERDARGSRAPPLGQGPGQEPVREVRAEAGERTGEAPDDRRPGRDQGGRDDIVHPVLHERPDGRVEDEHGDPHAEPPGAQDAMHDDDGDEEPEHVDPAHAARHDEFERVRDGQDAEQEGAVREHGPEGQRPARLGIVQRGAARRVPAKTVPYVFYRTLIRAESRADAALLRPAACAARVSALIGVVTPFGRLTLLSSRTRNLHRGPPRKTFLAPGLHTLAAGNRTVRFLMGEPRPAADGAPPRASGADLRRRPGRPAGDPRGPSVDEVQRHPEDVRVPR